MFVSFTNILYLPLFSLHLFFFSIDHMWWSNIYKSPLIKQYIEFPLLFSLPKQNATILAALHLKHWASPTLVYDPSEPDLRSSQMDPETPNELSGVVRPSPS